jgi:hypothetical protein
MKKLYSQRNKTRSSIQSMLNLQMSREDIKETLGISDFLFYDVKKKMIESQSILITPPIIHKYKVTSQIEQYINITTFINPKLTSESLSKEIKTVFNLSICRRTIDGVRKELGYFWRKRLQTFLLTGEHIARRFAFVDYHLAKHTRWDNVLFTDESYIQVGTDSRMVWRRPGDVREEVLDTKIAHPIKIMIWGGIAHQYKSPLIIFEVGEMMDSNVYINKVWENTNIIESMNNIYGDFDWVLQQDNAPCHRSRETTEYFRGRVKLLEDWPPHSPDLNVIELIWSWMKNEIIRHQPSNLEELKTAINETWNELTIVHIMHLITSMTRRLEAVYLQNGGQILSRI